MLPGGAIGHSSEVSWPPLLVNLGPAKICPCFLQAFTVIVGNQSQTKMIETGW